MEGIIERIIERAREGGGNGSSLDRLHYMQGALEAVEEWKPKKTYTVQEVRSLLAYIAEGGRE